MLWYEVKKHLVRLKGNGLAFQGLAVHAAINGLSDTTMFQCSGGSRHAVSSCMMFVRLVFLFQKFWRSGDQPSHQLQLQLHQTFLSFSSFSGRMLRFFSTRLPERTSCAVARRISARLIICMRVGLKRLQQICIGLNLSNSEIKMEKNKFGSGVEQKMCLRREQGCD